MGESEWSNIKLTGLKKATFINMQAYNVPAWSCASFTTLDLSSIVTALSWLHPEPVLWNRNTLHLSQAMGRKKWSSAHFQLLASYLLVYKISIWNISGRTTCPHMRTLGSQDVKTCQIKVVKVLIPIATNTIKRQQNILSLSVTDKKSNSKKNLKCRYVCQSCITEYANNKMKIKKITYLEDI